MNDDGKPYQCKHAFNCPYQLEAFKKVLQKMAEKPEEYIGEKGKRTTNTAEGFHGSALAYRNKRIDLNCLHYECKTNMAILHKVTNISLTCKSIIASVNLNKNKKIPFLLHCNRTSVQCGF